MGRIRVEIPTLGDEGEEFWAKVLLSIEKSPTGKWYFRGVWIDDFEETRLQLGDIVMVFGTFRQGKYAEAKISLYIVKKAGLEELFTQMLSSKKGWIDEVKGAVENILEEFSHPAKGGHKRGLYLVPSITLFRELIDRGFDFTDEK